MAIRAVLAVLVLFGAVPARAQLLGPDDQPGPLVRAALGSPYGRAMLAELGKSLRESADPACLQSKGLTPEQLAQAATLVVSKVYFGGVEDDLAALCIGKR